MLETSEGNETTMSYSGVAHAGPPQPSSQATQPSGDASMPSPPFPSSLAPIAPAPWRLRATVYALFYWTSSSEARELATPGSRLHSLAYPALEGASGFGRPGAATSGTPVGGMSMIQLLRYSDTPVGPYDEMVLLPGLWEYEREVEDRKGGKRRVKKRHLRVSRIYVSTTDTAINGRRSECFAALVFSYWMPFLGACASCVRYSWPTT